MGILHKLVYVLQRLDPDNSYWKNLQCNKASEATKEVFKEIDKSEREQMLKEINDVFDESINYPDYARKLYLIENCIYGVDIQPIAVQISKLRFFISLFIDQKINPQYTDNNYNIRPLPNLETKFVAANTLIGLEKPKQLSLRNTEIEKKENQLKELRHRYFKAKTRKDKINLQRKDKTIREEIAKILIHDGWGEQMAQKIASFDLFDQNISADWFDPEWMFGVDDGFDIIIGNPPYVSTKGIDEKFKTLLTKQFGFADDLYSHFYFKGIELLKSNGILAFISSKTFWTIQTKKNLRELLFNNHIKGIYDTANPFESAMVDTCVILLQKNPQQNAQLKFLKINPKDKTLNQWNIHQNIYNNAINKVIFEPNEFNFKVYEKYNEKVRALLDRWWNVIKTSKDIEKNKRILDEYRKNLKPGDVTLLGLITEGGQGLATANNGKYVGVLEGTKEAERMKQQRKQKFWEFVNSKGIKNYSETKQDVYEYLDSLSEEELRKLFDDLKEKYGRDIFGQGFLYRIVSKDEIADVETLTEDGKLNGIKVSKTFVPYDKGDKEGNRWYLRTPYYIDWSRENVKFLKENSGKKGEGMPVVRNPQFYFREGFCWTDVSKDIRCRVKEKSVHDVLSMSLFTITNKVSPKYIVCILNSNFISKYHNSMVNNTVHFQINDARQLPIIIPTSEQLKQFEDIFNRAYSIKVQQFDNKISEEEAERKLSEIQRELDEKVLRLYGVKS